MAKNTVRICTARIILIYKQGCGELWVEKRLRQNFPFAVMSIHSPYRRRIELLVFNRPAGEALAALNREAWVSDVKLTDKSFRVLPRERQPLHVGLPEKPSDMDRPFPWYGRTKGGSRAEQ